ncbi:hypothetical protein ABET51_11045 [Metabacillus fastidiosus]|uniref:hypothetical protein n=1 Tax=Metabacillus fastidiosus TaxID=1458 RepID=UPI003D29BFB4
MENWIDKFNKMFDIKKDNKKMFKVIIGQQPYMQKLGNVTFKVKYDKNIYKDFGNVAFFVSEWIKVQDSLEMIFNLLFGKETSLKVIVFLKEHDVSPQTFADYLYREHCIILVNRFGLKLNENQKHRPKNLEKIINTIKNELKKQEVKRASVLFVGDDLSKRVQQIKDCEWGLALHPSGVNLNNDKQNKKYYQIWYYANEDAIEKKSENFKLKHFKIFN